MISMTETLLRAKKPVHFRNGINQIDVRHDESGSVMAHCRIHVCAEVTTILSLHVTEDYRGCSLGTLLIRAVCTNTPANTVDLDDMSDHSGSTNSIYYKVGFRAIDHPFPEMTGIAREVVRTIDQIQGVRGETFHANKSISLYCFCRFFVVFNLDV